ncbi:MAG: hypothetical protein QM698_00675 [Micropepsaceae bacterium]
MPEPQDMHPKSERAAGLLLLFISFAVVSGMANHPSSFAEYTAHSRALHGILIVIAVLALAAFARFAVKRGLARLPVLLGLAFLTFGTIANALAGTMNGFIVPELMADGGVDKPILALCWAFNQVMAQAAVYASGIAFLIWGADMAASGEGADRAVGAAGALAGLLPAVLLAAGLIDMNVGGAFIAYSVQAAFALAAAWTLLRR